jgi:NADH-quinone oxidoreductase subunit I
MFLTNYIKEVFTSVRSLLKGMRMTGYYFMHPRKEIITQQYPEAVPQLPDRFQG